MKILIIADVYPPEVSSAASLIQELSLGLKKRGEEVTVLTTRPRHYLADNSDAEKFPEVSEEGGIKIIRVKTPPLKKINFILRGVSQLFLPYILFLRAKKYLGEKIDGVIVYSPPITLAIAGSIIKRKYGAKFLLNLQDIFPQNAIDLGILKSRPATWLFEKIEKFAYRRADIITFHSPGGLRFLREKKMVPEDKTVVLSNWVDISDYRSGRGRDFRNEYGLEDKFIFLFGGILGPAQGLESVVKIAEKLKGEKRAVFLLVGDGSEKNRIMSLTESLGLKNVVFKNFASKEDYPALVRAADVGLVCLSPKNKTAFVPGKFLGYMAAGKPVLAILNKESDGFELVKESGAGFAIPAGDLDGAEKAALELLNFDEARLKKIGANGLNYAEKHFSLDAAILKIVDLVGRR